MAIDPEIRQRLLELVYDLLDEKEAVELRASIQADAELAQAYAEAQSAAGLFLEAARLESAKIELKRPAGAPGAPAEARRVKAPPRPAVAAAGPWTRGANWLVGLAAGILLLISFGGYVYHRAQLADIAADHLRLRVTGPAELHAGATNRFSVTTTSVAGTPIQSRIEFALFSPDGAQLMRHNDQTDEEGRLEVTVAANQSVPDGARLEVVANNRDRQERIDSRLSVAPLRYATQLSLDKPLYRPGETVFYRSLTLSRFGLAADREMPIHFEVLDPGGAVVGGSELEGVSQRGVGCGEFQIPPGLAGGEYTLVARSLDEAFPEQRRTFFIRSYRLPRLKKELEFARDSYTSGDTVVADFCAQRAEGGPAAGAHLRIVATVDGRVVHEGDAKASRGGLFQVEFALPERIQRGDGQLAVIVDDGGTRETIVKTIPINLGKVDVSFYPEGGDLVAGLENRVYFVARDPLGEPVHIEGRIVDGGEHTIAEIRTTHEGMGTFSLRPRGGEKYHLEIRKPADVQGEPDLPFARTDRKIVLTAGVGVFDAGKPLEFNVRATEGGLPLVASAWCRGMPAGHEAFVTERGANEVAVELDGEAAGVIRLTVFDYSTSPPEPVAERLVYRRPARGLVVRVIGHGERYSPGEAVSLSLMVTDESGSPARAAAVGVAVVDDALLSLADDDTPGMPTHFLLTTEVENPEDLEDAGFYLSDDPDAAPALDLLLGTQGWRRFVEKTLKQLREEGREDEQITRLVALGGEADPPAVFDNLADLQTKYKRSLAAYWHNRTRALNTLTTLSFFGGLGLLLVVAMLAVLNVASGVRLWAPAVVSAAACLIIGVVLMNPERSSSRPGGVVAYAPFNMAPPAAAARPETGDEPAGAPTEEEALLEDRAKRVDHDEMEEAAPEDRFAVGQAVLAPVAAMPEQPALAGKPLMAQLAADEYWEAEQPEAARELMGGDLVGMGGMGGIGGARFGGRARMLGKDLRGLAGLRRRAGLEALRGEELQKALEQYRFTVREYRHAHVAGEPGVRSDFAETLYWHPLLVADEDGRAEVQFELSDSVTTFRVLADAHASGGRIGSGRGEIISRIPFNLEPKLPLEVTAGDRIDLPLAVVNDTDGKLPVEIALEHGDLVRLEGEVSRSLELGAEERAREYFVLDVVGQKGDCELTFRGTAGRLADSVRRPLVIVPPGFPKDLSYSGQIDGQQEVVVRLPDDWVPGSLEVALNVFPSTLADLQKGMESILREPCGCFEQASTSNYPNVLTLQYMQEHDVANPDVTRRARELLEKGYVKLTGYESPTRGYEWFGGDPGHEALTAYGLMEFRDMAEVYDVDEGMLQRTADWLLARRDGKGGFERNPKALDSFGAAPEEITDAYVTWALSESGQEGIEAEIEHVGRLAAESDDPYLVALAAASVLNASKKTEGAGLLDKLADAQAEDGHLEGTSGSITRSGGQSLKVETTALAALAWMKLPAYAEQANHAIRWLTGSRQGSGGFGSTQATILALSALIEHAKASRHTVSDGKLIVKREDAVVGEQTFTAGHQETISMDGMEAKLTSGDNRLEIGLTGDNKMPYALDVSYRSHKPASDETCPVRLSTKLAKEKIKQGDTVALTAELTNSTDQGQPMTVAILGLPAGLEARPDQLEEVKKAGTIDYYETRAREVICYWRALAPEQKVDLKLDLVAAVPGRYTGPASRAYLYYTAEQKQWTDPLVVEVTRE